MRFVGMGVAELRRQKRLEQEDRKLKTLLADPGPRPSDLAARAQGKAVRRDHRRAMVGRGRSRFGWSERGACAVLQQPRATPRCAGVNGVWAVLANRIHQMRGRPHHVGLPAHLYDVAASASSTSRKGGHVIRAACRCGELLERADTVPETGHTSSSCRVIHGSAES